jgi:hypothetical protein
MCEKKVSFDMSLSEYRIFVYKCQVFVHKIRSCFFLFGFILKNEGEVKM